MTTLTYQKFTTHGLRQFMFVSFKMKIEHDGSQVLEETLFRTFLGTIFRFSDFFLEFSLKKKILKNKFLNKFQFTIYQNVSFQS